MTADIEINAANSEGIGGVCAARNDKQREDRRWRR